MISLDNLKTTINAIKYLLTNYPKKKDIPTKFPNPNPLTFSGAITGSHNGSEILTVEISETLILYPSTNNLTKNTFNQKNRTYGQCRYCVDRGVNPHFKANFHYL